jgi:hypothetical protein
LVGAGFAVEFAFDAVLVAEWLAFDTVVFVVVLPVAVLVVVVVVVVVVAVLAFVFIIDEVLVFVLTLVLLALPLLAALSPHAAPLAPSARTAVTSIAFVIIFKDS